VLLRPLPYQHPDRLAFVWNALPNQPRFAITPGRFLDVRARASAFDGLAAISQVSYTLTGAGEPERIGAHSVSANFFEVLGTGAALGRTFTAADGGGRVVVLSHALWTGRFGSATSIVGRPLTLNGVACGVGVMPASFVWPMVTALPSNAPHPEMWVAAVDHDVPAMHIETDDLATNRRFGYLRAVGRLKPGVTVAQAQSELDRIAEQLGREYPETDGGRAARLALRTQFLGAAPALHSGGAVALSRDACANVASLLLGRATTPAGVRGARGDRRRTRTTDPAMVTEAVVLSILAAAAASSSRGGRARRWSR
jgi:putative ABC transport system permease protein